MKFLKNLWDQFNSLGKGISESLVSLLSRVAIASVFWRSVQTKITGWEVYGQSLQFFNVTPSTVMLFQYEYQAPLLSPASAAYLAATAEFFFPILLLLGLCTRFAALGLLGVTAVIQFFVIPEGWPVHILWLAILLYLLKHGGGKFACDYVLLRRD